MGYVYSIGLSNFITPTPKANPVRNEGPDRITSPIAVNIINNATMICNLNARVSMSPFVSSVMV